MDKYDVNVAVSVYETVANAKKYISQKFENQSAAENKVEEIIKAIRSLEIFPERGFNVDERFGKKLNPNSTTRGLAIGKDYIILYDIDEGKKIVNVRHLVPSRSDYMKLFK